MTVATELQELEACEIGIKKGLEEIELFQQSKFAEIGQYLKQIRDKKLFKAKGYKTFEAYREEVLRIPQTKYYELVYAGEVIEDLADFEELPQNSDQCRALSPLPTEQRKEVWQEVVETVPAESRTRQTIADVVKRLTNPPKLMAGQAATVIHEDSPHLNKKVEVVKVEGAIATCKIDGSEEYPFLATELHPEPMPEREPEPEKLRLTLTIARQLLQRCVDEADLPQCLFMDIRSYIG